MANKECTKCIHKEVCKTADSCDGYAPWCKHFNPGWIPVKERLPEQEGDYLIYVTIPFSGGKFMAVMHYEKDAYQPIWADTTHWTPLPEPPKGE